MTIVRELDSVTKKMGFIKNKAKFFSTYTKKITANTEYIIYFSENKKKHSGNTHQILLEVGIRFITVEELIDKSTLDAVMKLGWRTEDYISRPIGSVYEKLVDGYIDVSEFQAALDKLESYTSIKLNELDVELIKSNICCLVAPEKFSSSTCDHLARRALAFAYFDKCLNDINYVSWYESHPELIDNPSTKVGLDKFMTWLLEKSARDENTNVD